MEAIASKIKMLTIVNSLALDLENQENSKAIAVDK